MFFVCMHVFVCVCVGVGGGASIESTVQLCACITLQTSCILQNYH